MRKIFVLYLGKCGTLDMYVCHFETRALGKRNVHKIYQLKWTWFKSLCHFHESHIDLNTNTVPKVLWTTVVAINKMNCHILIWISWSHMKKTGTFTIHILFWKPFLEKWPVALEIAWHSLGTAERTVSKSCGLHTVTQSGRFSISRSSLMVNATCNGPLRPISFTRRTLLHDSASKACSVMSVLYKNHQLLYITSLFHFFQATDSSSRVWVRSSYYYKNHFFKALFTHKIVQNMSIF